MGRLGWISALAVGAVAVGGAAVYAQSEPDPVTVERVIDGDTVDVRLEGETQRIRLLNVDTPETKHPQKEVQCLGPEAADFLQDLLPAGQEVELQFDQERTDRYGRILAGVVTDDGLVNAEVARAGLGVAVSYEPNTRFYSQVKSAQQEAEEQGIGLFDESVDCTVPAAISTAAAEVGAVSEDLPTDLEGLEEELLGILAAAEAIALAQGTLEVLSDYPEAAVSLAYAPRLENMKGSLRADAQTLDGVESEVEGQIEEIEEQQREEEERREAERQEAERLEKEQREAQRAAEEAQEAERARQAAQQQPAPQPPSTSQPAQPAPATEPAQPAPSSQPAQPAPQPTRTATPEPDPPAPSQGGGGGGGTPNLGPDERPPGALHRDEPTSYTGPRCFLPGGQWWKPC